MRILEMINNTTKKDIMNLKWMPMAFLSLFRKPILILGIAVFVIVFFLVPFTNKSVQSTQVQYVNDNKEITILFAGDVMQHMPQVEAAYNKESGYYNYDTCFSFIKNWLSSPDLTLVNLETTLDGKPYSGYPAFSSPDALINSLLWAGVDMVGTANNHCCDRGKSGLLRTIYVLDSLGMPHFGTYSSKQEYQKQNPKIVKQNGFRLAFLNYTYGTNGIPVPENTVVSLMEKDRILKDLKAAKESVPDKIIVYIHWGEEYQRLPNNSQKDMAEFLFENGADFIIGSHPHVLQPMEWYKADSANRDKIVVWSLGNFVSNQRKQYTDGGAMFELTLEKKAGKVKVKDAGYRLSWVYNPIVNGQRQYYILPAEAYKNDSLWIDNISSSNLKRFLTDSRELFGKYNIAIAEKH